GRGDGLRVGDVDERAEAEAVYQPAAVPDRDRLDTVPEQGESSGKLVERQVGLPPVERELVDEGIGEALAQGGGGVDVRVDRQVALGELIEAAQVVEAADVVGVGVGEEDRIDPPQPDGKGLQP